MGGEVMSVTVYEILGLRSDFQFTPNTLVDSTTGGNNGAASSHRNKNGDTHNFRVPRLMTALVRQENCVCPHSPLIRLGFAGRIPLRTSSQGRHAKLSSNVHAARRAGRWSQPL